MSAHVFCDRTGAHTHTEVVGTSERPRGRRIGGIASSTMRERAQRRQRQDSLSGPRRWREGGEMEAKRECLVRVGGEEGGGPDGGG